MKTINKTYFGTEYRAEVFRDIYEFVDVTNTRPTTSVAKSLGLDARMPGRKDFRGTDTYEEADRLFQSGYDDGLRMIEQTIATQGDRRPRRRMVADVYGITPHIPNTIMDDPRTMWNIKRQPQKSNEITIYYDRSAGFYTSAETLARCSRLMFDAVSAIEQQGTKVNLYIMASCKNRTASRKTRTIVCSCIMKLKSANQHINKLMMAYPMVHPAFFRRHIFRWQDTSPLFQYKNQLTNRGCVSGSGIREQLVSTGIIEATDYYVRSADITSMLDIDELIAVLNKQTEQKINLQTHK